MQLKRNDNQLLFFVIDDMITQEKIQKPYFFFFWGGGGVGGGEEGDKMPKFSNYVAVNRRTKFRITHWLEKRVTTLHDKPWRLFCKTSLNARE